MPEELPPRITRIEPDPRRRGSVRITLDGKAFLSVSDETVVAAGLTAGSTLTEAQHAGLCRAGDVEAALRAAYRAAARRPYAAADLNRRLVRRGHPPHAAASAVERAQALGVIDDREFAQEFVRVRSARGHAPSRIRRDLTARGVSASVADSVLAGVAAGSDQLVARARSLAEKRVDRLRNLSDEVQHRRLIAFLERRGYQGWEYHRLVREVIEEAARG